MGDLAKFAMNQITTGEQWSFRESVEGCAAQGVRGMGIWRDRLVKFGVEDGAKVLRDNGMSVASYCFGGLFGEAIGTELDARIEDTRRMIDEAAAINAACVVLLAGGLAEGSTDKHGAQQRALDALDQLVPYAKDAGVTLGLEPLHPMTCALRSVLVTTGQALEWIEQLGSPPELGIVFDVYATWWDPEVERSLERASGRLCAFHLSDWLRNTQDLRVDRGMMGDGCIDLRRLREAVDATGYSGYHEVEILSARDWWQRDPAETTRISLERFVEHG